MPTRLLQLISVFGVLAVLAACERKGVQVGGSADAQASPAPSVTPLDRNLIVNGDAEMIVQGNKESIDSWSKTADALPMNYGGMPDEWQNSKPGCPDGRERYFRLALAINEPSKSINQRSNVIGAEKDVDEGSLECALGGWFGGWVGGDASAKLEVDFLGEDGSVLSTLATEAPDPASLPKPELGRAAMVKQIATGPVPPKTRRLEIRLVAVRTTQKLDTNAVATADSLSLVLRRKGK